MGRRAQSSTFGIVGRGRMATTMVIIPFNDTPGWDATAFACINNGYGDRAIRLSPSYELSSPKYLDQVFIDAESNRSNRVRPVPFARACA